MSNCYTLTVAGVTRRLPIRRVAPGLSIASFVILGDCELVVKCAPLLAERLPAVDALVTAEAKGVPLTHELARLLGHAGYIVARKTVKPYMDAPLLDEATSITTQKRQLLCLDSRDALSLRGKTAAIIDDVISTGESVGALERLIEKAGGRVAARAAILAEGEAASRKDVVFLAELPLFYDA